MAQPRTRIARWLAGAAVGCGLLFSGCSDGVDLNDEQAVAGWLDRYNLRDDKQAE